MGIKSFILPGRAVSPPAAKKEKDCFTDRTYFLDFPDQRMIEKAFLDMPDCGRVIIAARFKSLFNILTGLERAGFFGICITLMSSLNPVVRLTACKGRGGPCYDTGRTAGYTGGGLAALDDDCNVLFGNVGPAVRGSVFPPTRICEKTAAIFRSSVYRDVVTVSPTNPELCARLKSDPVEFEGETLDEQVEKLARYLEATGSERQRPDEPLTVAFYPGPFRMLILRDGTVLSRGRASLVKRSIARDLKKSDRCIRFHADDVSGAEKPGHVAELYKAGGAACLLKTGPFESHLRGTREIRIGELEKAPKQLREKLETLIMRQDKYFILTGSDPWDEHGCCPSKEVGAANRLVEAGILTALSTSAPGACPTSVFAFSGEIVKNDEGPRFTINKTVRKLVYDNLRALKRGPLAIARAALKWALLLFAAAAVAYMAVNPSESGSMNQAPSKLKGNGVLVYFFYPSIRCAACLNMEKFTEKTLNLYYGEEVSAGSVLLERVNIDDPANAKLVERYAIYNTAIVLAKHNGGKIMEEKLLFEQIWELFDSESEFIEMLHSELSDFLEKPDG